MVLFKMSKELKSRFTAMTLLRVLSRVRLFAAPLTVVCQAPLPMEFSRQEFWSGVPLPTPRDLLDPGIKPTSLVSPALADRFFTTEPPGKPRFSCVCVCVCVCVSQFLSPNSFHPFSIHTFVLCCCC